MKINILDSSVYNRISAGEVVENPSSIVKELVENSIDAGATHITVKIEDGGIKSVEVTDNGLGIAKEELSKTILSHATSKISTSADLDSIATLGFRGEALASIASVSEIDIKSRYFESSTGARLHSKNDIVNISDFPFNGGTKITVSNLFYNTPVRFKFLRTKRGEQGAVTALMSQLILSNPTIAFSYYADSKLIYSSSGEGLFEAIKGIYSSEVVENLIPVIPSENNIEISGYISTPNISKSNRSYQTININGRIVSDVGISSSIQNAYGDRLMHRCFPILILNILMPFNEVDINVHPNKKEVRFASPRQINGAVYNAVKVTLEQFESAERQKLIPGYTASSLGQKEKLSAGTLASDLTTDISEQQNYFTFDNTLGKDIKNKSFSKLSSINLQETEHDLHDIANEGKKINLDDYIKLVFKGNTGNKVADSGKGSSILGKIIKEANLESLAAEIVQENPRDKTTSAKNNLKASSFKVVGQVFNTYLVLETKENMLIIDQHAAHERLLYDQLVKSIEDDAVSVQPLLVPYIYQGQANDIADLVDIFPTLTEMGFDIEEFGANSIKINALPLILSDLSFEKFIGDIINSLKGKGVNLSGMIRDKLMLMACKAAIKGGDSLSEDQIEHIVDYFISNNIPLKCPHGRPAYIAYTKSDLEKLFRRRL